MVFIRFRANYRSHSSTSRSARQSAIDGARGVELHLHLIQPNWNTVALFQVGVEAVDLGEEILGVGAGVERMAGHLNVDRIAVSGEA